jgi:hypothetical protein
VWLGLGGCFRHSLSPFVFRGNCEKKGIQNRRKARFYRDSIVTKKGVPLEVGVPDGI